MSETAHTPGPWESNSDGSEIRAGKIVIADCIPERPRDRAPREQFLPNARLIAAAPDLLAALVCLIPQTFTGNFKRSAEISHWERERDLGNGHAPIVLAAFAAIAKATGAE